MNLLDLVAMDASQVRTRLDALNPTVRRKLIWQVVKAESPNGLEIVFPLLEPALQQQLCHALLRGNWDKGTEAALRLIHGAKIEATALEVAAFYDEADTVERLLPMIDPGADLTYALYHTVRNRNAAMFALLASRGSIPQVAQRFLIEKNGEALDFLLPALDPDLQYEIAHSVGCEKLPNSVQHRAQCLLDETLPPGHGRAARI